MATLRHPMKYQRSCLRDAFQLQGTPQIKFPKSPKKRARLCQMSRGNYGKSLSKPRKSHKVRRSILLESVLETVFLAPNTHHSTIITIKPPSPTSLSFKSLSLSKIPSPSLSRKLCCEVRASLRSFLIVLATFQYLLHWCV